MAAELISAAEETKPLLAYRAVALVILLENLNTFFPQPI